MGVPQIGCACRVCTSRDPRDRRRRCGAYVSAADGSAFLIDTPPEMRLACLEYGISKVDAVVLTHAHMDHVAGFDDLRRFNTINGEKVPCTPDDPLYRGLPYRVVGKPMTCHAMRETVGQMHSIFPYIGAEGGKNGLYRPMVEFSDAGSFLIGPVRVERFAVEHGFPCCGYLMKEEIPGPEARAPRAACRASGEAGSGQRVPGGGTLAYASDCHDIPDEAVERMKGVDVLAIDCLREREHPTHLSLERALGYIERIAPRRAYLVHLCHDLTHEDWLARLAGTGVEPAYDGLEVEV